MLRPTNGKLLFLLEPAIIFAGTGKNFCYDPTIASKFFLWRSFVLGPVKFFVATGDRREFLLRPSDGKPSFSAGTVDHFCWDR